MTKNYQAVFVTHLPSFYKINLYNVLAQSINIFVVFIGESSNLRAKDFTQQQKNFDFIVLNHCAFEARNKPNSCLRVAKLLRTLRFKKLILGGWDLPEYWVLSFLFPKKNNCLALESSIFESQDYGARKHIKSLFLKRISTVFYSGVPHLKLIKKIGFQGLALKTLGVGITNYSSKQHEVKHFSGKFIYVGRLAPEKNLLLLLNAFKELPNFSLTLVGEGPLKSELMRRKSDNVTIVGHVPHTKLVHYYQKNDIFILPSLKEPWGLVVEEALYYHLPIIASEYVGASIDLVQEQDTGVLFDPHSEQSLMEAILKLAQNYSHYEENTQKFDFTKRDQRQVQAYVDILQ